MQSKFISRLFLIHFLAMWCFIHVTAQSMIEDQVQNELSAGMFTGAVVMAGTPDSVVYLRAFGNRDTGVPMEINTMFDMASITKVAANATALAILMTDSSHISINDPASIYLDGLTGTRGDIMTIRELATHTAGIDANKLNEFLGEDLISRLLARNVSAGLIGNYSYSCNGTIRLSELIAQQSGKSFGDYCHDRLFQPMGMSRTMFGNLPVEYRDNVIKTDRVFGGISDQIAWRATGRNMANTRPVGNAGLFSTAEDLSKLARLWLQKGEFEGVRYFSEEIYDIFTVQQANSGVKGILWSVGGSRPAGLHNRTISHSGHTGQMIWIDPVNQWYIIVLTNWAHPSISVNNSTNYSARQRVGAAVVEYLKAYEESLLYADSVYNISFQFLDADTDDPLSGVEVQLNQNFHITNESGEINFPEGKFGYYSVNFNHDNYLPFTRSNIKITSDTLIVYRIQQVYPSLSMEVFDKATSNPVYRAYIEVGNVTGFTTHAGEVVLSNVMTGEREFTITHNDYFDYDSYILIKNDTSVIIELTRKRAHVTFELSSGGEKLAGIPVVMGGWSQNTSSNGQVFFFNMNAREDYSYTINHSLYEPISEAFYLETDTLIQLALAPADITSINNQGLTKDILQVYPNPARDNLFINLDGAISLPVLVKLTDITGNVVYRDYIHKSSHQLELSSFKPGIYFISLDKDSTIKTIRVVITGTR